MRRVMVMGAPGSGKSRLAVAIGARLGLPVLHLDAAYWAPGWVERPRAEVAPELLAWYARDARVIDGKYTSTPGFETSLARADTMIWLDLPLGQRYWQVLRRTLARLGRPRPDLAPGCREGFGRTRRALFACMWRTRVSHRAKLARLMDALPAGTARHHLTSRRAVADFLETLR